MTDTEKTQAMQALGDLLAATMPAENDDDSCESGLEAFCSNTAIECGCDFHRDAAGEDIFSMQARREMGLA